MSATLCRAARSIAAGRRAIRNGLHEVLEHAHVRGRIRYHRRRGARGDSSDGRWPLVLVCILQIDADEIVAVEPERPVRTGELDLTRVAGVRRRRRLERADGAVGELQHRHCRVLDFDRVKAGNGPREHATHRTEQPQKQIDRVHALVHQGAAAVERMRATPARIAIVGRRPVPLDARVGENRRAEPSPVDERLHSLHVRLEPILEDDAERHARVGSRPNERIRARRRHIDRLLDEHVQAADGRRRAVIRVQAGGRANHHHVEGALREHLLEGIVRRAAVPRGELLGARRVRRIDGGDFGAGQFAQRSCVRIADVARTNQADKHGQLRRPRRLSSGVPSSRQSSRGWTLPACRRLASAFRACRHGCSRRPSARGTGRPSR